MRAVPDEFHRATVAELDALVAETHQLWDEEWVGFSWRNYTHEHMRRVRGLAGTLADAEGADPRVVTLAATLHDVTKSYDGEILVGPDGKRVLDENGFWRNESLPPARSNAVTTIYDQLGLVGSVHHVSGGAVARVLLELRGFSGGLIDGVEQAIIEHLIATPESSVAGKCLYDADTIDANIGMPAFYRNIQISLRGQDSQFATRGESFRDWLSANLGAFLDTYLRERIPAWIDGKARDFVPKLMTSTGRDVATERLRRLSHVVEEMASELGDLDRARRHGAIRVVESFMTRRSNPRLVDELDHVEATSESDTTMAFVGHIRREVAGHA
jgi:hypothetical protein